MNKKIKRPKRLGHFLWIGLNTSRYFMLYLKELEQTVYRYCASLDEAIDIDIQFVDVKCTFEFSSESDVQYAGVFLFPSFDNVFHDDDSAMKDGVCETLSLKNMLMFVKSIKKCYNSDNFPVYVCEAIPILGASLVNARYPTQTIEYEYDGYRSWKVDMDVLPFQVTRWNSMLREYFDYIPFNFLVAKSVDDFKDFSSGNETALLRLSCINVVYEISNMIHIDKLQDVLEKDEVDESSISDNISLAEMSMSEGSQN